MCECVASVAGVYVVTVVCYVFSTRAVAETVIFSLKRGLPQGPA